MSTTNELLQVLEDTAALLEKTQVNLKKCPKTRLTKGYVEARIKCIEDYWTTFKDTHHQLVKITPKEQKSVLKYFVNEDYFIYEDLYLVLLADLKDILSTLTISRSPSVPNSSQNNSLANSDQLVRLPRIQLPSFSGSYEDWPTFQDLFISLVHQNAAISDVQKLHYLKSSVTGEAETLLKPIQITNSNYEQAWTVLKSRYGNKRLIINSVLKRLFNQKKISSPTPNQIKSLLDVTTDCLNNLQNLNIPTSSWDPIIIFLVIQKLDPESHKEWEQAAYVKNEDKLPTWNELKDFLQARYRTLELVTSTSGTHDRPTRERSHIVTATSTASPSSTDRTCVLCIENHTLCHCKNFIKLQPIERAEYVKTNRLCFNCLVPGHSAHQCRLKQFCRICHRRHHTLLHRNQDSASSVHQEDTIQSEASHHSVEEKEEIVNTTIASHHSTKQNTALLATATVLARNEHNHTVVLRALVDQGSQASFITEKATQMLKLSRQQAKGSIIGVGSTRTNVDHVVQLTIGSRCSPNFEINIQAYVMSKQLTTKIPSKAVTVTHWPHLDGLDLADPDYHKPGPIDLLLGVKEYAQIVQQQLIKGPPGSPCAQETNLGWILFGEVSTKLQDESFLVLHHQVDMDYMLRSLWEIDTENKRRLTKEEKLCETIYENTHARTKEGRYVVKLPFKTANTVSPNGNTKEVARNRLLQLERRFRKAPKLKEDYKKAMQEYIKANYMEEIPENERKIDKKAVYLPHHAVVRADKDTSKTRVVFDASAKGSNHISLNDELLVGPQLQDDLRDIVMRSRLYRVCYASDIQKMYLQVLLFKEDADTYQRLLWREEETDPIKEYRMLRVTFGTASAPYLAVRTLHQVAEDEGQNYPKATEVIKSSFYMDDLIHGNDFASTAIKTAQEVSAILEKGGFTLSKWSSNSAEFMQAIEPNRRTVRAHLDIKLDGTVQALGLIWNLGTDQFQYKINLPAIPNKITKRSILSDVQKLFDPLGWIAPSLVMAKILLQKLWLEKTGWDDEVNQLLVDEWITIREEFNKAHDIHIDRWLGTLSNEITNIEIHGYSDASMRAYAAAAYIRVKRQDGSVSTKLIAAKTRVAPLRTVSLPRLELCGALLLSKLLKQIENAMRIPKSNIYAWTDSSIVLAWLAGDPHKWKTFVANRVVEIIENVNNSRWFHVASEENPADIGSRGMLLRDLQNNDLWWKGPAWLSEKEIILKQEHNISTEVERKNEKLHANLKIQKEETITSKFTEFSNVKELIKVITYCRRFLNFKRSSVNIEASFTTKELERSLVKCIQLVQEEEFEEDIQRLKENKMLKKESKIKSLNPYLDDDGLLRVGGRLRNADLEEQVKHPIIVGNNNNLAPLIVADAHSHTLHGGVQLMLGYIRSKYWILRGKALVKACIHKCLICAKLKAISRTQMMGDLPRVRVTPARAFLHTGVDFAGPFQISMAKGRGMKTQKSYICLFICMSTKAIHLELVSDLSSEAFIAAFKRFVARRGKCSHIWSDQGRNFVGANKDLITAFKEANLVFEGDISNTLALEGTQWHFIPAYSPNFGGLWEAGVKSVKHHLKRVLNTHLTYEEMSTVLCQIEACLNSRPLCPIDEKDLDSMEVLTPGHFLIGEAPIVVPSVDFKDTKTHCLSRWQYTQKLLGDFWRRWQQEYLTRLQQRPTWLKKTVEFQLGDIVLIKSEGIPPGKFPLGRVVDKHPGQDGLTRVYSIKSGNNVVRRCVSKLCPLPIPID